MNLRALFILVLAVLVANECDVLANPDTGISLYHLAPVDEPGRVIVKDTIEGIKLRAKSQIRRNVTYPVTITYRLSVPEDWPKRNDQLLWDPPVSGISPAFSLRTDMVPVNRLSLPAYVGIDLRDARGKSFGGDTARLTIHREHEPSFQNEVRVIHESHVPSSGCMHGEALGKKVSHKLVEAKEWRWELKSGFEIPISLLKLGIGFEVERKDQKTTDETYTSEIPPNEYGMLYKITQELEVEFSVIQWTPKGESSKVGSTIVPQLYVFHGLATGRSCNPPPRLKSGLGKQK